jgi:hypothetical protein
VLATIPIGRMRQAGLLDALIELARGEQDGAAHDSQNPEAGVDESIDDMDLEALIRMTQKDVA